VHTLRQTTNRIDDGPASIAQTIEVLHAYEDWLRRNLGTLTPDRMKYASIDVVYAYNSLLNFLGLPESMHAKDVLLHVRAQIESLKRAAISEITLQAKTGELSLQTLKGHG
jgi:hypothetical protein